jgi:hypothetical protein
MEKRPKFQQSNTNTTYTEIDSLEIDWGRASESANHISDRAISSVEPERTVVPVLDPAPDVVAAVFTSVVRKMEQEEVEQEEQKTEQETGTGAVEQVEPEKPERGKQEAEKEKEKQEAEKEERKQEQEEQQHDKVDEDDGDQDRRQQDSLEAGNEDDEEEDEEEKDKKQNEEEKEKEKENEKEADSVPSVLLAAWCIGAALACLAGATLAMLFFALHLEFQFQEPGPWFLYFCCGSCVAAHICSVIIACCTRSPRSLNPFRALQTVYYMLATAVLSVVLYNAVLSSSFSSVSFSSLLSFLLEKSTLSPPS